MMKIDTLNLELKSYITYVKLLNDTLEDKNKVILQLLTRIEELDNKVKRLSK